MQVDRYRMTDEAVQQRGLVASRTSVVSVSGGVFVGRNQVH